MTAQTSGTATFLGHPRGLATLFFIELFERFSYYGMRALLVLFLTASAADGGLGVDTLTAGSIYGLYASAVYLAALPGGWVADRLLGQQRSVWYGGLLISAGNFLLAVGQPQIFYLGLLATALGTGLLKPNVSAIVGELYHDQPDTRRDSAFSIFYMGINLGGLLAPLVTGTIGETLSFRWGFFSAGVAMLVGLAQYRLTVRHLGSAGAAPASTPAERRAGWRWVLAALALLASAVAGLWTGAYAVSAARLADVLGDVMVLLGIGFFGYVLLFGKLNPVERRHVAVLIVFFLCACVFWAGYEQAGSTLNLFARDLTDRSAFGSYFSAHEHPATWYQSVESICVVLLAPVFAWVWIALGRRNLNPSAPVKLSLGLMQLGAGYAVMMLAAQLIIHNGGKAGPQWLLLTYLLHTTGELCLSPIGLSNTTKLAPKRFAGQMMGTWFLGTALGNLAAGEIGGRLGTDVATMPDAFLRMTLVGVMSGLVVLALSPLIRRWMGGVR